MAQYIELTVQVLLLVIGAGALVRTWYLIPRGSRTNLFHGH